MKNYIFPYNILSGRFDCTPCDIDVDLSDEDAALMERIAKEGGRQFLSEDKELEHIYDIVLDAIIEEQKEYYRNDPIEVLEFLAEEYDEEDDEEEDDEEYDEESEELEEVTDEQIEYYLDSFDFAIFYPKELQMLAFYEDGE